MEDGVDASSTIANDGHGEDSDQGSEEVTQGPLERGRRPIWVVRNRFIPGSYYSIPPGLENGSRAWRRRHPQPVPSRPDGFVVETRETGRDGARRHG
jgi:hypothetical protein